MLDILRVNNKKNGFTIVEVVVVIVIIGILVGLGGAVYTNYRERSHNDTRATRAQLIANALEQYYSRNGEYPSVASLTSEGFDNNVDKVAELLELNPEDITDPASNDPNSFSIVNYNTHSSTTDTVFRYRGFSLDTGDAYECNENTTIAYNTHKIASLGEAYLAALRPGYCGAFVLSYRDTIANEWKNIRSIHNQNLITP